VVHHVVRRQFQKKKHYKNCIRHLTNEKYPYIYLLKPPLLADLQQKVGELVLSITSCHIIIILENVLVYRKKCGCDDSDHWYNVCPIHLHALLGVGNFMKVVRVCADHL
jgi:hypothetical protein